MPTAWGLKMFFNSDNGGGYNGGNRGGGYGNDGNANGYQQLRFAIFEATFLKNRILHNHY